MSRLAPKRSFSSGDGHEDVSSDGRVDVITMPVATVVPSSNGHDDVTYVCI
jgi:hypothetical protein